MHCKIHVILEVSHLSWWPELYGQAYRFSQIKRGMMPASRDKKHFSCLLHAFKWCKWQPALIVLHPLPHRRSSVQAKRSWWR